MNTIKTVKKGPYTLEHSWYVDDFGFKRNSLELSHVDKDGMRTILPFQAPIRVIEHSVSAPYGGDDVSRYTDEEYADMIEEYSHKVCPK